MPGSKSPLELAGRTTFEHRLGTLGFILEANDGAVRVWVGRVRATIRTHAGQKRRAWTHQVKVILGKGFPYQKPEVVPADIDQPIMGQRHQAPGAAGALCLYPDDANGWHPDCVADELIDRVRQWFVHYHNDGWLDRDRAPDLHLYFEAKVMRPLMIYGDDWKPPKEQAFGRFGVWQRASECAFAGAPTAPNGIPPSKHLDRVLPLIGLADVGCDRIGLWFRLGREPHPWGTLGDMLKEIDLCAGFERGVSRQQIRILLGDKVRDHRKSRLTLALGYPDANGREQWLFLQVMARPSGKNRRWSRAGDAIPIASFEAAPAGRADLMRRTGHTAKLLNGKRVLVFGVGAIGSSVAVLLAKAGVEQLVLADTDRMRPGNAVRNEAGLGYVGIPKVSAVCRQIQQHAPYCALTSKLATWDPDEIDDLVQGADVVVDATANEAFSLLLNHVCLLHGKTAVYVASYRRAAIGRVRIVRPGTDACKECYEDWYSQQDDYPLVPIGDEGEFTEGGCGVPTVEASAIDLEAIANVASRAVLHITTGRQGDRSECIIVNEPLGKGEGKEVFSRPGIWWYLRSPVDSCKECAWERG